MIVTSPPVVGNTANTIFKAIIGGGAAGTGAAMSFRQLPHRYNYTIYETEPELGGHAYAPPFHYVDSMGNNATFYVDMGFIFGTEMCFVLFCFVLFGLVRVGLG